MINLLHGNCLELMQDIPDGSVDMVLCDLPYGVTDCKWDSVIPMDQLWTQYKRIVKPNGAIVLFGTHPFALKLILSNIDWFKYEWIWEKSIVGDGINAKNKPMRKHENILVFSEGTVANGSTRKMPYYPQGLVDTARKRKGDEYKSFVYTGSWQRSYIQTKTGYPNSILKFDCERGSHPTQKPVPLCEYLIKTYTLEGETVLDNTMGSGTTGVACVNTNRKFIGIEMDEKYYEIAKQRIEKAQGILQKEAEAPVQLNLLEYERGHIW